MAARAPATPVADATNTTPAVTGTIIPMRRDPACVDKAPVSQGKIVPPRPAATKMAFPETRGSTAASSRGYTGPTPNPIRKAAIRRVDWLRVASSNTQPAAATAVEKRSRTGSVKFRTSLVE
jgi:hypothetical protein